MERVIKVGIVVVILGIVAYFGYSLFSSWHKESLETAKRHERVEWEKRTKGLMEKVTGLEEELTSIKGESIPEQKLKEVFGPESPARPQEKILSFEEIDSTLKATAKPLGLIQPNNTYGWGQVDAFEAVKAVIP